MEQPSVMEILWRYWDISYSAFIGDCSVKDLNRWWFLMKCSRSKFSVYSRPYSEVVGDKRFRQQRKL